MIHTPSKSYIYAAPINFTHINEVNIAETYIISELYTSVA